MKYEERVVAIMVLPEGQPIFSEQATKVEIVDEAAGEFVRVSQDNGHIDINEKEWPILRAAIDKMIKQCKEVIGDYNHYSFEYQGVK